MENWQELLKSSISTPDELGRALGIDADSLKKVTSRYPARINPYYLGLIKKKGDPIWLQAVPDPRELNDTICCVDPLDEENLSPVPNLIHKYPDRVLFLVNSQCSMYCRFCTRKRKVGTGRMVIDTNSILAGLEYLRNAPQVRDVLVSGGDPLLLEDEKLEWILAGLREIQHIDIIRIGSRVPCVFPMRITDKLTSMLRRFHPLYINTHFNHPDEITQEATVACSKLADAGIPLGCQTVLLRGVNDDPNVIRELMYGLLRIRVKPYYLFQGDMTMGTDHFRTKVQKGMGIMRSLIGHVSGMAVPLFAVDAPGGGGKIPLMPEYVKEFGDKIVFTNYCGESYTYTDGY